MKHEYLSGLSLDFNYTIYTEHAASDNADSGNALIIWSDGVANEWEETYPSLAHALGRLALLQFCQQKNWEIGFTNDPETFTENLHEFFQQES
jgi:hypothetical protein